MKEVYLTLLKFLSRKAVEIAGIDDKAKATAQANENAEFDDLATQATKSERQIDILVWLYVVIRWIDNKIFGEQTVTEEIVPYWVEEHYPDRVYYGQKRGLFGWRASLTHYVFMDNYMAIRRGISPREKFVTYQLVESSDWASAWYLFAPREYDLGSIIVTSSDKSVQDFVIKNVPHSHAIANHLEKKRRNITFIGK